MAQELKNKAQATVTTGGKKLSDFEGLLVPYQLKISQIAPKKGLQADRIVRMTAATVWMNEKLHNCDPRSILMATFQLAMAGLNPSPQFKEADLIPYGSQCQMQLRYLGIIKLVEKSALIQAIWAEAVYEGDKFIVERGTNPSIKHEEGPNFGDQSKVTHGYAVVKKASGGIQFAVLNRMKLERLRRKNKMQGATPSGAWASDYDEMAKAKALKIVLKTIPMEDEYRSNLFVDEQIATSDQWEKFDGNVPNAEYPAETQEGSAEVVTEPTKEQTEEEKNQAAFDAQMAKENGGGAGPLFQG